MEKQAGHQTINNDFYDQLGDGWFEFSDHPIALLRAENRTRVPWIIQEIDLRFATSVSVLDVGCGAGFLTNELSKENHQVTGIDLSETSLRAAKKQDRKAKVRYLKANAYSLPFPDQEFDVVCAMDILEHVEDPGLLIAEAARVLKPKGLFFFHTFNRNFLSYLIIIKGVEWFVKNTPRNMHVYPLFIKPEELDELFQCYRLQIETMKGFRPCVNLSFFEMLLTRKVPATLTFRFSKSLATGYTGFAVKSGFK